MKRLIIVTLSFFSLMLALSFTTPEQRRELIWSRVMADGTPNKFAGWDANGDPVELDGTAAVGDANELQKTNGSGTFQGSGLFSSTNGNLTLGDGTATSYGITVSTNTTTLGGGFTLTGESAKSGNNNGGYIQINGGTPAGTGFTGPVRINSGSISNGSAFQVYATSNQQNLIGAGLSGAGGLIFNVDVNGVLALTGSSEGYIGMNTASNQTQIYGNASDATPVEFLIRGGHGGVAFNGQPIALEGGDANQVSGNGNGGDVTLSPGIARGTGIPGYLIFENIPTSSAGLPSGAVWSNAGVLTIVP